jgi:hypothetical protein
MNGHDRPSEASPSMNGTEPYVVPDEQEWQEEERQRDRMRRQFSDALAQQRLDICRLIRALLNGKPRMSDWLCAMIEQKFGPLP